MPVGAGAGRSPDATCEVYVALLDRLSPSHVSVLDADERERRARFARDIDRDLFTLAAALVRTVAAARVGTSPEQLIVDRTCDRCGRPHGRPRLPGTGLHVSISHSGQVVVVAITSVGPVGVDVERVTAIDHAALVDDLCTPRERDRVQHRADFFRIWTRKESVLKATGEGLAVAPTEVEVSSACQAPRVLSYRGGPAPPLQMADLVTGPGYAAALTALTARRVAVIQHGAPAELAT